jgi:hypothetical protein
MSHRLTYKLTMQKPDGKGSVTPRPGVTIYRSGANARVSARAAVGSPFSFWLVDNLIRVVANPYLIKMGQNHIIKAIFKEIRYLITVTIEGVGTVTKTPEQADYSSGTSVVLAAVPAIGMKFDSWTIDGVVYTANPITVTV